MEAGQLDYGFDYNDFDKTHQLELCRYPFELVECDDGSYLLCRLIRKSIINTYEKIIPVNCPVRLKVYASLSRLFEDVLYMKECYFSLSENTREQIEDYISKMNTKYAKQLKPNERYILLRQFQKRLTYNMEKRGIGVRPDIEARYGVQFANFEEAAIFCAKNKIVFPTLNSIVFPTSDDLLIWVFEHLIEKQKEFRQCECCGKFFVRDNYNRKYCGRGCYQEINNKYKHLSNSEIDKLTKNVNQAFYRKTKSNRIYEYINTSSQGVLKEYMDLSMPSKDEYTKAEFIQMKQYYMNSYKKKYGLLKNAYRDCGESKISEEDYNKKCEEFICWLKEVREDLRCFQQEKY